MYDIEKVGKVRARCRRDLMFLAREILGYRKIHPETHRPVIDTLQTFSSVEGDDIAVGRSWRWTPRTPIEKLPGVRRRLILDPRSWFKTTLCTVSHSIQWILNYPDITIFSVHSSDAQAAEKYDEIKRHFMQNEVFRYYFPDYCPTKPRNWGNSEQFVVPNRRTISGTPTMSYGSIERIKAGSHYHVIKMADIVDMINSRTADQLNKVATAFAMFKYLLISPKYWIDVEGTRYDFEDVYGRIMESRFAGDEQWKLFVRSCYKRAGPQGEAQTFAPEEMQWKWKLDELGRKISWFPIDGEGNVAFPTDTLISTENDPIQGITFGPQMENNPVREGERYFPAERLIFIAPEDWKRIPRVHFRLSVDTADTQNPGSDDNVLTCCLWDRLQRVVMVDGEIGKWPPDELVKRMFAMIQRWRPDQVVIEETAYVRGLKPEIQRVSVLLNVWPNFVFVKRDTHVSKVERITRSLQPWYAAGRLRFSAGLDEEVKTRIRSELARFPKSRQDDVLDTLADQFQGQEWFGPEAKRDPQIVADEAFERWVYKIEPEGVSPGYTIV